MIATGIETKTDAQEKYERMCALWEKGATEKALDAVHGIAAAAMGRAEEVHAEHDRMIIDAQGAIIDLATGKLGDLAGDKRFEAIEYALYLQSEHIRSLEDSIEDLMAGGAVQS